MERTKRQRGCCMLSSPSQVRMWVLGFPCNSPVLTPYYEGHLTVWLVSVYSIWSVSTRLPKRLPQNEQSQCLIALTLRTKTKLLWTEPGFLHQAAGSSSIFCLPAFTCPCSVLFCFCCFLSPSCPDFQNRLIALS